MKASIYAILEAGSGLFAGARLFIEESPPIGAGFGLNHSMLQ